MLRSLDECADRIEAGELFFRNNRLLEAVKSIDHIVDVDQGRRV